MSSSSVRRIKLRVRKKKNAKPPTHPTATQRGNGTTRVPKVLVEPPSSSLTTTTPFIDAIFIENAPDQREYVRTYCPSLTIIPIDETEHLKPILYSSATFSNYIKRHQLEKNLYYHIVLQQQGVHAQDYYDLVSGFQPKHLPRLINWVKKHDRSQRRIALFDWDRTLTIIEGVRFFVPMEEYMKINDIKEIYRPLLSDPDIAGRDLREDMLLFLCGGLKRITFLRKVFVYLHKNNIEIAILTNNRGARTHMFNDLVRGLIPSFIEYTILTGTPYPFRVSNYNKGVTLSMMQEFHTMCRFPSRHKRSN